MGSAGRDGLSAPRGRHLPTWINVAMRTFGYAPELRPAFLTPRGYRR